MVTYRFPGPTCATTAEPIDSGTLALFRTASAGPVCLASASAGACSPPPTERHWYALSVEGGFKPDQLTMSPDGLALLKGVEQRRLKPYDDQTGDETDTWVKGATIGFGHLILSAEWSTYQAGISEAEADTLFEADLEPYQTAVRTAVTTGLQQYEYDALVILAFNIGAPHFKSSSVVRLLNDPKTRNDEVAIKAAWMAWNKSQGKVMKGLVNRRTCEWNIFTSARYVRW